LNVADYVGFYVYSGKNPHTGSRVLVVCKLRTPTIHDSKRN